MMHEDTTIEQAEAAWRDEAIRMARLMLSNDNPFPVADSRVRKQIRRLIRDLSRGLVRRHFDLDSTPDSTPVAGVCRVHYKTEAAFILQVFINACFFLTATDDLSHVDEIGFENPEAIKAGMRRILRKWDERRQGGGD